MTFSAFSAAMAAPPQRGGGGGKNKASLSLTVTPESFKESDPPAVVTVTRENSDTSVALTVTLTSNPEGELELTSDPEREELTVVIPAGEVSVDFPVAAIDDLLEDGNKIVTILAMASGHSEASASITVTDDETVNVGYSVRFIPIPEEATSTFIYDVNDIGQAVGDYSVPDSDREIGSRYASFLYDSISDSFISSDQMLDLDPQWVDVSFVGMNNFGAIVGRVQNRSRDISAGILVYPAGAGWAHTILPGPAISSRSWVRKINDHGDIVGTYYFESESGETLQGAYAINTGLYSEADLLPLTDFDIDVRTYPIISNARLGVVENLDGAFTFDFDKAYTLYDGDPGNDQEPVSAIPLPAEYYLAQNSIAQDGQLAAYERVLVSNKRGGTYAAVPAVFQDGVLLWKADFESNITAVNSAVGENQVGDVLGSGWLRHADRGYVDIEDMLVFDNLDEMNLWYSTTYPILHMSDRDTLTEFPFLGGQENDGPYVNEPPFVLVPIVLP